MNFKLGSTVLIFKQNKNAHAYLCSGLTTIYTEWKVFGKSPAVPTYPVVDSRGVTYARDLTGPGIVLHTHLMCAD